MTFKKVFAKFGDGAKAFLIFLHFLLYHMQSMNFGQTLLFLVCSRFAICRAGRKVLFFAQQAYFI